MPHYDRQSAVDPASKTGQLITRVMNRLRSEATTPFDAQLLVRSVLYVIHLIEFPDEERGRPLEWVAVEHRLHETALEFARRTAALKQQLQEKDPNFFGKPRPTTAALAEELQPEAAPEEQPANG